MVNEDVKMVESNNPVQNADVKMATAEKKAGRAVVSVGKQVGRAGLDMFNSQSGQNKLIIVVIAIVIVALVLWWMYRAVVGFMTSPMGMILIVLTIVAVLVYFVLRSKGVGFKSWSGGIAEVLMMVMFFVVYIGLLDAITGVVLMLAPVIIFGAVAYIGFKWYKAQTNKYTANGIIAMVVAFCVAVPIYQAYVVPYTLGTPVELTVDVSRSSTGQWQCWVELNEFAITTTMSTQFNPYLIGAVEFSSWGWTNIGTTEKAYVTISIQVESDNTVIYYENAHVVYVGVEDMETIWGVVHIPAEYIQYINVEIRMTAQVYNENGILATASGVYTH